MKKRNIFLISLFMLVLISVAASALTINTPSAGGSATGTYNFTATSAIAGVINCTWATTSDGIYATSRNETQGQSTWWNTTVTTTLTDAEDTTLTVICYNTTVSGLVGSEQATRLINVDNTNPVCACSLTRDRVERGDMIGYDCVSSSDTTDLTFSAVITYPSGATETETAETGDFEDTAGEKGDSTVAITVTDEVSKTNTCSDLTVLISSNDVGESASTSGIGARNMILILVLLAVAASIIVMSQKKK